MAVLLKPTWDHGTKFRLLPGISDIVPVQKERRRGQPGMAVLLKPTWDHGTMFWLLPGISDILPYKRKDEEDSQEWLSH